MPPWVRPLASGLAVLSMSWAGPLMAQAPDAAALSRALTAYGGTPVMAGDLRAIECKAIPDEPTEFDCRWEQRTGRGWHGWATWLAVEGQGWTVLDDPLPVPDPGTGKLKPLPPEGM